MIEKENEVKSCVVSLKELVCGDIINGSNIFDKAFSLNIPYYQRPYAWGIEQVKILLKDISEQIDKNQKYLLGSLILHKGNTEIVEGQQQKDNEFNIVDGQQRLTTLALILRVLCKCNFLNNVKYSHNESKYHIKENYEYIKAYFESYSDKKCEFLNFLLENIEFICVLAPSEDDAFLFFDSANSKGKGLKSYDLIKAFHLHSLEKNQGGMLGYYARKFENLAKDERKITILFDELLAPARAWLKHKNIRVDKIKTEQIYEEFCKEFFSDKFLYSKEGLGVLSSFANGVDFFEYLFKYNELFDKLSNNALYQELDKICDIGFIYNKYIYAIAVMIYFSKFPNGNSDYFLLLIARAAFSLRVYGLSISRATQNNYALEFLEKVYFVSFEEELEQNLLDFIAIKNEEERKSSQELDGGRSDYVKIVEKYYQGKNAPYKNIPSHYVKNKNKGINNE
ncbi:DUF262 domain-containing protein [Campylobacter sp. IFREMER_LSEM_CL1846]|uniref:DUF262 domain-containing protein n=1 Tax=Campylobacter sp. IFREMER_LSEM_CL1846 TaxID=2911614 RepID=UPI0021E67EB7|nr:DUF262 domain-containing protein [Campylobacter sp. IFREMER_LSEM_CL1846]HEC1748395.1 DUF262 domain-containing protein [Campylobacter lari]MCV3433643.1 DUF262 domain-containing protein [Campylobacter sp. IFREMER_LSEM_CL1846]HEC1769061.1 DUF262 domain-containing protein [Campylobacter lari]HEC1788758.1 DUF262 domain-containing protein [Campylobacter lari]HEC1795028.1 DUF262 domain-containing protein [Campylobacter lari]